MFSTTPTLKATLKELSKVIDIQAEIIRGLRQDNRDMLNRYMSRFDMKTYAQTSPASIAELDYPAEALAKQDTFSKEFLAGETVDET
jgi:hypothetical protein